jgi:hypothetical protein
MAIDSATRRVWPATTHSRTGILPEGLRARCSAWNCAVASRSTGTSWCGIRFRLRAMRTRQLDELRQ